MDATHAEKPDYDPTAFGPDVTPSTATTATTTTTTTTATAAEDEMVDADLPAEELQRYALVLCEFSVIMSMLHSLSLGILTRE